MPNAMGTGRASGKVILFGEHAVVYGVSAIAGGISRGARATATQAAFDEVRIAGELVGPDSELSKALASCRASLHLPPARVDFDLDLPAGSGLGASAALGVSAARALADLFGKRPTERDIFLAAQAWETVFHGTPSGVDVAAAMASRVIRFSKIEDPEPLILSSPLRLVVAQAGPPASTREMVEGVARFKERNPSKFDRTLEAIAALVENALLLLRSGDLSAVGKLMDLNQMLLAGWMLSTEEIEHACRLAREKGALGAKLTGAGGGGCVIALAGKAGTEDAEARAHRLLDAYSTADITAFTTTIGASDDESSTGGTR